MVSWQYIPAHLDPVVCTIGSIPIRWYAVMFVAGFLTSFAVLARRTRFSSAPIRRRDVADLAFAIFFGVLVGGRVGYAAFYDPSMLWHPLGLVSPFDHMTGTFDGIRGMSFFGGLFGAGIALAVFSAVRKVSFFGLADFVVPVVPIALFFGRIGNFLNLELHGRVTDVPFGMFFPDAIGAGSALRHPSQLYEAGLEGVALYLLLDVLRKKGHLKEGTVAAVFVIAYGAVRFLIEFVREPDAGVMTLFGWMTMGQVLSCIVVAVTGIVYLFHTHRSE